MAAAQRVGQDRGLGELFGWYREEHLAQAVQWWGMRPFRHEASDLWNVAMRLFHGAEMTLAFCCCHKLRLSAEALYIANDSASDLARS